MFNFVKTVKFDLKKLIQNLTYWLKP